MFERGKDFLFHITPSNIVHILLFQKGCRVANILQKSVDCSIDQEGVQRKLVKEIQSKK